MDFREIRFWVWINSSGLGWRAVTGSYEHSNSPSGFITFKKFVD